MTPIEDEESLVFSKTSNEIINEILLMMVLMILMMTKPSMKNY